MGLRLSAVLAVLASGSSCSTTRQEQARQDLLETDRQWAAAAATEDVERIVAFWTDDAVLYTPEGRKVGKDAIREFVKANRSRPGFSITWEPDRAIVSKQCDLGITLGRGRMTFIDEDGSPVVQHVYYGCAWRKGPQGWKCIIEFPWAPAPPPE